MPNLRIREITLNKWKFKYSLEVITFIALIVGLLTYKDYGISTDERQQRLIGLVNSKFIYEEVLNFSSLAKFENIPKLLDFGDSIFGSIYEICLIVIEILFGLNRPENIFETRHLLNNTFFIIVIYFFSKKASTLFRGHFFGVLCFLLFVLNPRIYVDSFYNTKDIVHMCAFMLGFLSIVRYLAKQNLVNLSLVSVATVFAINTRMTGVLLILVFIYTLQTLHVVQKKSIKQLGYIFTIYLLQISSLTIVTFPFLWSNPLKNFLIAIMKFARYPLDLDMNYWGNIINSESLPWHYFFSWFLVSNPLSLTILVSLSILICCIHFGTGQNRSLNLPKVPFVTFHFMIFFLALTSVIVLNSSLYNSWRHLFFIYPSLVYLCLAGIRIIQIEFHLDYKKIISVVLLTLVPNLIWMITYHPYGNLYFNSQFSKNVQVKFDVDYWGTANKEILHRLAKYNDGELIKIFLLSDSSMGKTLESIDTKFSSRFVIVENIEDADFLIDTFLVDRRAEVIVKKEVFEVRDKLAISDYFAAVIFQKISKN
ncbi:hypothetical protein A7sIIA15_06535 [Candidatus Planktophila vernalis]|uniref:Glycosyltransferase RgtA/B/C/D-like domain-containing protein n=1 Tax=Candidatus Planktophila vernalis TaxID=1884907 RepID=A0A249KUV9_9ACTN|nr:hypothetical protein [Candidatus Planktophila vernalis]ASY20485.1 hypothetical protein A7sIIA15_06535 [Candidatus Planktophila vernalis]